MLTLRTSLFLLFITLSSVHSRPLAAGRPRDETTSYKSPVGAKSDANAWGETSISKHKKRGTDWEQGNPPRLVRPDEEQEDEEEEHHYITTKVVYITKYIGEDEVETESPYPTTAPVEYYPPVEEEPATTSWEVSTTVEPVETISWDPTEVPTTESPTQETTSTIVEETTTETPVEETTTETPVEETTTETPVEPTDLPEETTTVEPIEPTTTPSTTTTEPVFPGEITTKSFILLPQETTTTTEITTTSSSTTTETPTSTSTTSTSTTSTTSTTTAPSLPINTPDAVTDPKVEIPTGIISDDGNLDLEKFGDFLVTQLEETTPQATGSPVPLPVACQGCGNSISKPLEGSGVGRTDVLKKGLGGWIVTGLVGYVAVGFVGLW